jgi:hypothetical protein
VSVTESVITGPAAGGSHGGGHRPERRGCGAEPLVWVGRRECVVAATWVHRVEQGANLGKCRVGCGRAPAVLDGRGWDPARPKLERVVKRLELACVVAAMEWRLAAALACDQMRGWVGFGTAMASALACSAN